MISWDLYCKIRNSIELLQRYEKLSLKYSHGGFHLAFSGGKDSQVIYELAKMAGVKFSAYFYKTSIDPKELLSFIRTDYPNVKWINPEKTMFRLILEKKCLPTRRNPYCCFTIKESRGLNTIVVTGVRKQESKKRENRKEFYTECKNNCDKNILNIILDWNERDVFSFLEMRGIPVCILYNRQKRIGCVGCCKSCNQLKEFIQYPNVMKAFINTLDKVIVENPQCNLAKCFFNGQDAFNWWVSGLSVKKHIAMRDLQTKIKFD